MTYKAIIADDEPIIREGMKDCIAWEAIGFEIVGVFADGQEIINYIKQNHVDLIFTDIKMKKVSGIEVAKYVFENKLDIKVCLLSGYKEFELARQAINYNVTNLFMKPSNFDEINKAFAKIKCELDNQTIKSSEISLSRFLSNLYYGSYKKYEEAYAIAHELIPDIKNFYICVIRLSINKIDTFLKKHWHYGSDRFFVAIFNFLQSNFSFEIQKVAIISNEVLIFVYSKNAISKDILEKKTLQHFDIAQKNIYSILKLETNFEIDGILSVSDFINKIIKLNDSPSLITQSNNQITAYQDTISTIISNIIGQRYDLIEEAFNQMWNRITCLSLNKAINLIYTIFYNIVNISVLNSILFMIYEIELFYTSESFYELHNKAKLSLKKIYEQVVFSTSNSNSSFVVQKIKYYIEENFQKNISLQNISKALFFNTSYISRVFNECTGFSFKEYLLYLRITKAMILLRTPEHKIHEIGTIVGYTDAKYFMKQFKSATGLTPQEYRNKANNNTFNEGDE